MKINRRTLVQSSLAACVLPAIPVVAQASPVYDKCVSTGIPSIDSQIGGGLRPGMLNFILGEKLGDDAHLLNQIGRNAIKRGYEYSFYNGESENTVWIRREVDRSSADPKVICIIIARRLSCFREYHYYLDKSVVGLGMANALGYSQVWVAQSPLRQRLMAVSVKYTKKSVLEISNAG